MEEDEELHLEMHRAADELGKYAAKLHVHDPQGFTPDRAMRFMDDLLSSVARECFEDGADLIGHIKAFLNAPTGTLMGSLVDLKVGVQLTSTLEKGEFEEAEITLHVIVHGIWDDKVRDATRRGIRKVIREHHLELEVLKDHFDTERSIEHHLKK
jgi:hypothetical protein